MKNKLIIAFFLLLSLLLTACSNGGFKAETNWKVQPFNYESQNGEKVSLESLEGDVWLAQFIFTNCKTVCPPMMYNMVGVQDKLMELGLEDYKIVNYSVDPAVDTPDVMAAYLEKFNVADESKWILLTGYEFEEISDFAAKSFRALVVDDKNSDQVIHGTLFYLVNQEGRVVKSYSGDVNVPYEEIAADVQALLEEGKE